MKKAISLAAIFVLLMTMCFQVSSKVNASSDSYITMEFNQTIIELDDIITATIKINNIPKFSGYQANIRFDPEVLQAVNPESGKPYTDSTTPSIGNLLVDPNYDSFQWAAHDLQNGILNVSKTYLNYQEYKDSAIDENTGTIAVIGFKVLKLKETEIYFENTDSMPNGINGTILFDWDGNRIPSGYEVRQPESIKARVPSTPTVVTTPTPTVAITPTSTSTATKTPLVTATATKTPMVTATATKTPTVTATATKSPTPTPTSTSANSYISIDFNKETAVVGDVIKATIKINNIDNFAGCHINIKYDPNVLMAVDAKTGTPYKNNTVPEDGGLLVDNDYSPFKEADNDLNKGVLNFSKAYLNLEAYRNNSDAEKSGILGVIGFRVLKEGNTSVYFEDTSSLPNAITGTILFDWYGNRITSGYSVVQPNSIKARSSTVTPTPTATPKLTPTPTGLLVKIDSDSAAYGEEITVPIRLRNVPSKGIFTGNLTITYDEDKLRYIDATAGSIVISPNTNFAANKEKDGVVKLLFLDYTMTKEYIRNDGIFINLKFKVITDERTTTIIKTSKMAFGDRDLKAIPANIEYGTIRLNYKGTATNTPKATPTKTPKPTSTSIVEPTPVIPGGAVTGEHKAYIKGYPDGCFRPKKEITRAEAAVIVAKFVKTSSVSNNSNISFPDVANNHWAKESIELVAKAGLFKGYPDGTFRPDDTIKRGEFATVIYKMLDLKASSNLGNNFTDIDNHWAKSYILELANLKYINGYSDKTFKPEAKIKRDECVVMVNRALKRGPLNGATLSFSDVPKDYWAYKDIAEAALDHKYYVDSKSEEVLVK
ncbi:MAG: S-layer protein [Clostridiaceae bacterium]|jgi:hypothetical protein|nr:S-layer protein [Clostridiaceae bacterium]